MELTYKQCASLVNYAYKENTCEFTCDGVNSVVNTLPDSQQNLIKLRFIDNMTYQQIGEAIGVSRVTVRERLVKCTSALGRPIIKLIIEGKDIPSLDDSSHIDTLGFRVRTRNALLRANISTVGELTECTSEQLMQVRSLGNSSIKEIEQILNLYGMRLKENSCLQ